MPLTLPQFGQGRPMVSSLDQFKKPGALFRYFWAAEMVRANGWGHVLDAACGCGYGSWLIAEEGKASAVIGIDMDAEAIDVAKEYWKREGVHFLQKNILSDPVGGPTKLDVVVSLETIEHVENPRVFISRFRTWAPNLIATVPDENVEVFDAEQFPFHFRHYTLGQFRSLLLEFYDSVLFQPYDEAWLDSAAARTWLAMKMSSEERQALILKLRGNLRVVARTVAS